MEPNTELPLYRFEFVTLDNADRVTEGVIGVRAADERTARHLASISVHREYGCVCALRTLEL